MTTSRKILIIAGPNGAGKTVFATEFLPNEANCPTFINADLIAASLRPFRPDLAAVRAAGVMLNLIHDYVRRGEPVMTTQEQGNRKPVKQLRDPDFVGAEAAMHRAAALARRRAIATSGSVAVFRDGKIVQDTAATELSVDDTEGMQS